MTDEAAVLTPPTDPSPTTTDDRRGAPMPVLTDTAEPPLAGDDQCREVLRRATQRVAPLWELEGFVAVNPYLGLTDLTFTEAAARLDLVAGARSALAPGFYREALEQGRLTRDDVAAALATLAHDPDGDVDALLGGAAADRAPNGPRVLTVADVASRASGTDWSAYLVERVASWAAAYFDQGQASWRSTDPQRSPYAAWRDETAIDRSPAVMGLRTVRRAARDLPTEPLEAASEAIAALGLEGEALDLYLHGLLLRVPGWAGFAARKVWDAELRGGQDDTLLELLAVLVSWEALLLRCCPVPDLTVEWARAVSELVELAAADGADTPVPPAVILQEAFDRAEERRLAASLPGSSVDDVSESVERPSAQLVFCIDVRSEVFRRHLEAVAADVETLGFAGFFGVPIHFRPVAHAEGVDQCPVLLTPGPVIDEVVGDAETTAIAVERRTLAHHVRRAWKSFKMGAISCFSFVGPVGLLYLPKLFTDGFGRTRPVAEAEVEGLPAELAERRVPRLEPDPEHPGRGIAPADRIAIAEAVLRAMSLTAGFAPLVALTGHGATTVNNPYDKGLDCGACGGHTGEANARVTAMVLNDPAAREALVARGIEIPADTWFLAAQHDTTTDHVAFFDREDVPSTHAGALAELEERLAEAGRRTRAERADRLNLTDDERRDATTLDAAVLARSTDWAQVRPEWGLAGCRTFIAAPRHRTAAVDLAGRSFLHSYDWRADEGFGVLELIMSAPMVVPSWISLQYYGSTVDNELFGSGNKTLHNVTGRLGVLEGAGGDLRSGLPWQSVHDGTRYQHEPLRLNVVIEAPLDAMTDVLAAHPGVRELVDHGWIKLLALGEDGRISHRYAGGLDWETVAG